MHTTTTKKTDSNKLLINAPKLRALPVCNRGGYHKNKKAYDRKAGKSTNWS